MKCRRPFKCRRPIGKETAATLRRFVSPMFLSLAAAPRRHPARLARLSAEASGAPVAASGIGRAVTLAPSWAGNRAHSARSNASPAIEQVLESRACGRKCDARLPLFPRFVPPNQPARRSAVKLEPIAVDTEVEIEPPAFAEVRALFDACECAGVVDEADRPALPEMLAINVDETRELLAGMLARAPRCSPTFEAPP